MKNNIDCYYEKTSRWDNLFISVCNALSIKVSCKSRRIGSVIVRDNSIVSTGYNGPARGFPHCKECKRKDSKSGEDLHLCPAAHAEQNAIVNAARNGVSVLGCTLYLNTDFPCKDCMTAIVNAGIVEVVSSTGKPYHRMSLYIAKHADIRLRRALL